MEVEMVKVFIEIEQFSNIKYEYDKTRGELVIDRLLPAPYLYPYSYGFIPDTMAPDNDELDVLIITNKPIENNEYYDVCIIGCLLMEDEKGTDEKILCVFPEDFEKIQDVDDLSDEVRDSIFTFFSEYKSKNASSGKWSRVHGFSGRIHAKQLYEQYRT